MRIGQLMNESDWFTLQEEFPLLKDRMTYPSLIKMAEVMLDYYFNRPDEAQVGIAELIAGYANEIPPVNMFGFMALSANIHRGRGRYQESADEAAALLEFLKENEMEYASGVVEEIRKLGESFIGCPPPAVSRVDKDIELPYFLDSAGRGVLMRVPVVVKGKEYNFIFDTGAGATVVSQDLAEGMGVKICKDSILMNEETADWATYGMLGYLDELSLVSGNIVAENLMVAIIKPNEAVDTVYHIDAILGVDILKLLGEFHILPRENKIVFPVEGTPMPETGCNMLEDGNMWIKLYSGDERLVFTFDTGCVKSEIYSAYYLKHKDHLDEIGVADTQKSGTVGHIGEFEVLKLSDIPLRIGGSEFELHNVDVFMEKSGIDYGRNDGRLGMDFIRAASKIVVNFNDMFVDVEF